MPYDERIFYLEKRGIVGSEQDDWLFLWRALGAELNRWQRTKVKGVGKK